MKEIINVAGSCISAIMTVVAISLIIVLFYRHIPTPGMDLVQRTAVIQNDGLNVIVMHTGFFLVFLIFTSVREFKKYKQYS